MYKTYQYGMDLDVMTEFWYLSAVEDSPCVSGNVCDIPVCV